jgi:hypothetical protein
MDANALAGVTMMLGNAALTGISAGATTNSSSATPYTIKGKAYTHAADSGVATPTTDAVTGAAITLTDLQARLVVWCLDANDAIKLVASPAVKRLADGTYPEGAPMMPSVPGDLCPYAVILHAASGLSGTFTVGSSNWNTGGMTHTVTSLATLPDRLPV